jgi:hypothetical protein
LELAHGPCAEQAFVFVERTLPRIVEAEKLQENRRICWGVSGVGSASEDFRDTVAEIGWATNSPVSDWLFLDFRTGGAEISGPAKKPITDWLFVSRGEKPIGDWLICG